MRQEPTLRERVETGELLPAAGAAEFLEISVPTLGSWVKAGHVQVAVTFGPGRYRYFERTELARAKAAMTS